MESCWVSVATQAAVKGYIDYTSFPRDFSHKLKELLIFKMLMNERFDAYMILSALKSSNSQDSFLDSAPSQEMSEFAERVAPEFKGLSERRMSEELQRRINSLGASK